MRLCRWAGGFKGLRRPVPEELCRNLEFSELPVEGEEVSALASLGAALGGIAVIAAMFSHLLFHLSPIFIIAISPSPLLAYIFAGWYPSLKADREIIRGQGEAPRLISYMTMTLRVNPNLERSAKFAAERVGGALGRSLREELRRMYLRIHEDIEEAISKFVHHWKGRCKELERSMYLLRISVSEREQGSRLKILDRALELSLEGVRERMMDFASKLHLPTLVIYGLGVLLPLVFLVVLPVLSVINLRIGAGEMALVYCVVLPLSIYGLGKYVLTKRPLAFPPPEIPMRGKATRSLCIAIPPAAALMLLSLWTGLPPTARPLLVLWGLALGISTYLYLGSADAYRARLEEEKVEEELHDALIQLGNHMGGRRPAEDAFRRAAETSKGSRIAKIFERASANIRLGGMRPYTAFFDPDEGALKDVRSPTVRSALQVLIDAMERGSQVAGEAVLSLANHLRELKRVETDIRRSLGEIVNSMRSVALFFAPFIAATAACLQEALVAEASGIPFLGGETSMPPEVFLYVMGFYTIVITCIMMSYSVEIERGADSVMKTAAIARSLPTAMMVFTFGVILGKQVFSFI